MHKLRKSGCVVNAMSAPNTMPTHTGSASLATARNERTKRTPRAVRRRAHGRRGDRHVGKLRQLAVLARDTRRERRIRGIGRRKSGVTSALYRSALGPNAPSPQRICNVHSRPNVPGVHTSPRSAATRGGSRQLRVRFRDDRGVPLVDLLIGERAGLVGARRGARIAVDDVESERAVLGGERPPRKTSKSSTDSQRSPAASRMTRSTCARGNVVVDDERDVARRGGRRGMGAKRGRLSADRARAPRGRARRRTAPASVEIACAQHVGMQRAELRRPRLPPTSTSAAPRGCRCGAPVPRWVDTRGGAPDDALHELQRRRPSRRRRRRARAWRGTLRRAPASTAANAGARRGSPWRIALRREARLRP